MTLCVILRVGVARAIDDPDKTLKGIYLLACICAGGIGGAAFVIFRQGGLLVSSALGGFASSLFLQAFKSNGLIESIGLRYILYLGLATLAFSLACHSRLQAYILILSSAIVGATTVILGIDCFTRANLKEFYVRNLGFDDLFEKKYPKEFSHHHWYLSTASIIELGVIGGLILMAVSFQGKMWAEFRASVQMMRHDDEERRMQAKAKRAAKKIFASAQKDLQEWEERHGYRKTVTRPEVQEQDYIVQNVPSSDMVAYQPKGSAISLLPMKAEQDDTPAVEYPPTLAYEPTLAESMGLLHSPVSGSDSNGTGQERESKVALSKEQQKLVDEIANIRKSIDVLRSASPGTAMSASSDYQDAGRRASSASYMRQSRDELSARTPSPWLTKERSRSQSISTRMQGSAAVNPDLFAGPDRKSPYMRSSSPRPISPMEEPLRPSSTMLPRVREPSNEGRARADSDSRVLERIARSARFEEERRTSHSTAYSPPDKDQRPTRIITESPDEAAARYAKSLGRMTPKSRNSSRKSSEASTPVEYTKRATTMSMAELQARHESRMKALQRPTSKRVQEEASLIKAKEDWVRRSMLEKKRWDNIEREQRRESMPTEGEERPRRSTRSKSMMMESISPPPAVAPSHTLQDMPEQSGVSRAKEWRQSLKTETKQQRTPAFPQAMRRRHSAHSQPLLQFGPEAIPEEARQQV